LARRAKSYSDFYEAAVGYFGKEKKEKIKDPLEAFGNERRVLSFEDQYDEYENDPLDSSHEEYQ
jgi:ABC-type transporter lipoprotein component MlaA